MAVVALARHVLADVVQERGVLEHLAVGVAELVQVERLVEQAEREPCHVRGVRRRRSRSGGRGRRPQRGAAPAGRPTSRRVVAAHRVEHDAFAQRPVARGQPVEAEQLERDGEQRRTGGQELGAACSSRPGSRRRSEVFAFTMRRAARRCRRAVARSAFVLAGIVRSPGRSATARRARSLSVPLVPTASFGFRLRTSCDERLESGPDPVVERVCASARDGGSSSDALGGEPADAERDARGPAQPGRVADHELDAAAADVDAERRARARARGSPRTAAKMRRASSRPLITSTSTPVSASMRSTSSLPFAAVRIALVALAMTSWRAERVGELAQAAGRSRSRGRRSGRGCGRGGRRRRRGGACPSRG